MVVIIHSLLLVERIKSEQDEEGKRVDVTRREESGRQEKRNKAMSGWGGERNELRLRFRRERERESLLQ